MRTNVYECMFILDTNKVAGDLAGTAKQLNALLEKNNAEVLAGRQWADTKLMYPIKNHKKGLYYITYFRTEGKNVASIERDLQLNETVLRSMILRVDPKQADAMMEIGRNEGKQFHQTVNTPPDEDLGDEGDRGRRGPRRAPDRDRERDREDKES
jgi:small subunit ribosomal protein S6